MKLFVVAVGHLFMFDKIRLLNGKMRLTAVNLVFTLITRI